MNPTARRVQHPALLGLVLALTALAGLGAVSGLVGLHAARLAGPVPLITQTEEVADALGDSPWVGSDATGPVVWAFVKSDTACCGSLTPARLVALSDENMELRIVVVAPRTGAGDTAKASAATLAVSRDWADLRRWADGAATTGRAADPAETEGYVEWGRASYDRVAALLRRNGVEPRLPLVIWRAGPEWRVLVSGPGARIDSIRRDMAVDS